MSNCKVVAMRTRRGGDSENHLNRIPRHRLGAAGQESATCGRRPTGRLGIADPQALGTRLPPL